MALLDRVRERTGSDLSDIELQAMIDAIAGELDARFGPAGQQTVELGDPTDPHSSYRRNIRFVRPIDTSQAITVIEINPANSGAAGDETVLAADDYRVTNGGRTLVRLTGGSNPATWWAPLVRVTFTPLAMVAARDEVTIKLIQLDLSYRGALKSERAGDYSFTLSGDMAADRMAILQVLEDRRGMVLA